MPEASYRKLAWNCVHDMKPSQQQERTSQRHRHIPLVRASHRAKPRLKGGRNRASFADWTCIEWDMGAEGASQGLTQPTSLNETYYSDVAKSGSCVIHVPQV